MRRPAAQVGGWAAPDPSAGPRQDAAGGETVPFEQECVDLTDTFRPVDADHRDRCAGARIHPVLNGWPAGVPVELACVALIAVDHVVEVVAQFPQQAAIQPVDPVNEFLLVGRIGQVVALVLGVFGQQG